MAKKYILAIAIFVIFLFSTVIFKINEEFIPVEVKQVFNNQVDSNINLKKIQKEEPGYKINIYYPETKYKNLNEYILRKLKKIEQDFLEEVKGIGSVTSNNVCTLDITFCKYEYKSHISFAFEEVIDLCGAHPNSYCFTVNYDTNLQKIVNIEDFLKKDEEFLNKLSYESYLVLKDNKAIKEYSNDGILKEGLRPIKSNFENIIFDKDKIIIFINRYQVAPYVAGSFEVKIPYSKVM